MFFSNGQKFRDVSPQPFQWIENYYQKVRNKIRNKMSHQSQWHGVGGSHSFQDTSLVSDIWPSDLSREMDGAFPASSSVVRLWGEGRWEVFHLDHDLRGPWFAMTRNKGGEMEWQPDEPPTALQPFAKHPWLTFRQLPPLQSLFFREVPNPALPCPVRSITSEVV